VDKIVPRIVDNVFKNSPVLTRLKNKRRFQFEGGLTIRHNIMYAPLKGGSYQRGQAFDTSVVQTDTALYFNIKQYLKHIGTHVQQWACNKLGELLETPKGLCATAWLVTASANA
jgi:hypothetical protein